MASKAEAVALLSAVVSKRSLERVAKNVRDGEKGDQGERGEKGDPGESITGPKGDKGDAGLSITGPSGQDGRDGTSIVDVQRVSDAVHVRLSDGRVHKMPLRDGKDGKEGPKGRDGKDGQDGLVGRDGEPGKDGKDGRGIASARIKDNHLIITYTDGTKTDVGRVVGRDGKKGERGPRGFSGGGRVSGPRSKTRRTVTSDYAVVGDDDIINADASGGDLTVTLPALGAYHERELLIKRTNASGGNVIVATPDGALIENEVCRIIDVQYWSLKLYELDGAWWEY